MLMPARASLRAPSRSAHRLRFEPMHVAAVAVAALVICATVKSLSETDLFWHVPLGQQILESHRVHGAGSGWTIAPGVGHWTSSEWLGEVTLAWTKIHLGWAGILWLRLALALVLVGAVLRLVLTHSSARVSAVLMAAIGIPLATGVQERPQLVSLILLCPVALWASRILRGDGPPRWLVILPMVFLWAQIHPLWLLCPAFLLLGAGARVITHRREGLAQLRDVGLVSLAALAVGCLTPVGPRALTLPLTLHSATSRISEWQPTSPLDPMAWGLMLVVALVVTAWVCAGSPLQAVEMSELAYSAAVVGFALLAYRNILPAMILLVPVVGPRLSGAHWGRSSAVTQGESRVLAGACAGILVVAALIASARTAAVPTFASKSVPVAIGEHLAADGREHRILNAYNASGALVAFGGPGIRLAVDGRADRWGAGYLNSYLDALGMHDDWRGYIAKLDVTDAVLQADAPIVGELIHDRWAKVMTDAGYVLLTPPR